MARCYYLDFDSISFLSEGVYYCKLCGQQMKPSDPKIKYTCNAEYGEKI